MPIVPIRRVVVFSVRARLEGVSQKDLAGLLAVEICPAGQPQAPAQETCLQLLIKQANKDILRGHLGFSEAWVTEEGSWRLGQPLGAASR